MANPIDNAWSEFEAILNTVDSPQELDESQVSAEQYFKMLTETEESYESIRQDSSDINKISTNIDKDLETVGRVKTHIFFAEHDITYQDGSQIRKRLDADPLIANAWNRLTCATHTDDDLAFFAHEEYESLIEIRDNLSYNEAHELTIIAGFVWNFKGD
ncbi:hypothetical protein [Enterobacter asburiae]|uniref:hypothetical protein n=1 Tax=Enterobacter asburiae TaxID=61645 RepID=UPI003BC14F17